MVNVLPSPGVLSTETSPPCALHDMADERESQATTLSVVNQRIADAVKLFEDTVLFLRGDPNAVVDDLELYGTVLAIQVHTDKLCDPANT